MTFAWFPQIVNLEEMRRRQSLLGDAELPLPEFSQPSTVLSDDQIRRVSVRACVCACVRVCVWS